MFGTVAGNLFICETLELVSCLIGKISESFAWFYFAYFFNEIKYNKIFTISKTKKRLTFVNLMKLYIFKNYVFSLFVCSFKMDGK